MDFKIERNNDSLSGFNSTGTQGERAIGNSPIISSSSSYVHDYPEPDICRVCRCEASFDKPLFYPCVCTGSIKYIHQECLVQWLKYSKKEYCELCKHKFSFAPIYHPDMPSRLPVKDILTGLFKNILKAIKFWLHSTLVAISWLAIVPLTACRIYRCLFAGSVSSLLTLPLDMLSTENIVSDILQGGFIVLCSLGAFISLVWLREQIMSGGGPDWLEINIGLGMRQENNIININNVDLRLPNRNRVEVNNDLRNPNVNEIINDNNEAVDIINNLEEVPNLNDQNNENLNQQQNGVNNDENHWNPIEWDRAAEDLTWDRLLGLDGSLLFLEHVFWVISLNTLFILVFAFCPYHLGHYMIYGLKLQDIVDKTHFEGLITTLVGYVLLAEILVLLYASMSISPFNRAKKIIGLCYIVIKVALLVIFEICVFPLICGIWLDICSLKLFNSTLEDRINGFEQSPGTSVFIHWLVGMIYVFYFATFVFLLREVLRPGLLWFLRNLNDPDFNPVQEMIQLPVFRHIRRFFTSVLLFGFSIILLLLIPVKLITYISKFNNISILPYNISSSNETFSNEFSVELLWLHAALPALLEQSHIRLWIKSFIKIWANFVSWILGISSYLLGEQSSEPKNINNNNVNNINDNGVVQQGQNPFQFNIGIAHQALLQNSAPFVNEPYNKPSFFKFRIAAFILIMCKSLVICSIFTLIIPMLLGRYILYKLTDQHKFNELYTIVTGFYTIWLGIRLSIILYGWLQIGLNQIIIKCYQRIFILIKSTTAILMIFGFLPLIFGLLFQQIIINPISSNHDQTPIMSFWQIFQDGIRNIDLKFILLKLVFPVTKSLGLALAIPCVLSKSIAPLIIKNQEYLNLIERRIYPLSLFIFIFMILLIFQVRQFRCLFERIRNDKYLVGQRLINFERNITNSRSMIYNNSNN